MKLAHSPLTDNIYIVKSNGKIDVTDEFIFCVISRWKNQIQTVTDPETGKSYDISVKEITTIEHAETSQQTSLF